MNVRRTVAGVLGAVWYQGVRFASLLTTLSRTTITAPRKQATGASGPPHNQDRPQPHGGDIFIDHGEALVVDRQAIDTAIFVR